VLVLQAHAQPLQLLGQRAARECLHALRPALDLGVVLDGGCAVYSGSSLGAGVVGSPPCVAQAESRPAIERSNS